MIDPEIKKKAEQWLDPGFDTETRDKVRYLLENDPQEVIESFYRNLEFGTGGLRGIMGVGTNRMNKYTVGMATQGLANYLKQMFPDKDQIKVAIAHDSRNKSDFFARITAEVFSANGIIVYLFDGLRPTPELSYAIRLYGCQSGVVITASHNPKEYNGYKAYWDDGGQLIPPHDKNVISEVGKIKSVTDVKFHGNDELIHIIGEETDEKYLEEVIKLSQSPSVVRNNNNLKIVFTPLHGTGAVHVPEILKRYGFNNIAIVEEQAIPDGNFPTVISPNPEEPAALEMALNLAKELDADLVMGTDPDADRVGIAVRDLDSNFVLLNGNQAASLLLYYILKSWSEKGMLKGKEFIVKTIVTSELLFDIAKKYDIEHFDVLTGFKWIADLIRHNEGFKTYIAGGEESYGYMIGDFVRDKDAVSACALIAETAAWAADQGKSLYQILIDIYMEFGLYKESLVSIVRKGKSGSEEIQAMMDKFRQHPPESINNSKIVQIKDYLTSENKILETGEISAIDLPKSNVLQFFLEDGSKISMRPSGTEPKIKFYFGVKEELKSREEFMMVDTKLKTRIEDIIESLGI